MWVEVPPRELERVAQPLSLSGSGPKITPESCISVGSATALPPAPPALGPGLCPLWPTGWLGVISDLCLSLGMAGHRQCGGLLFYYFFFQ